MECLRSSIIVGAESWRKEQRTDALCQLGIKGALEGRSFMITSPRTSKIEWLSEETLKQLGANRYLRKRIRFAYVRSISDVMTLLSEINTWRKQTPCMLLLDGLNEFVEYNEESNIMALLCAALFEAVNVCSQILNRTCQFYVSIDTMYWKEHEQYITVLADNYFGGNVIHLQE